MISHLVATETSFKYHYNKEVQNKSNSSAKYLETHTVVHNSHSWSDQTHSFPLSAISHSLLTLRQRPPKAGCRDKVRV